MNKRKYAVICWDWREDTPIAEIIANAKWYKEFYEYHVDDMHYLIFSDSTISTDEAAENVLYMETDELDNL